jgi:hypothetical protein
VANDSFRLFCCAHCGSWVRVCATCDRGQRYCPDGPCAEEARREAKRRYRADYQRTRKGRRAHARAQACYREKRSLDPQKVTDHPSPLLLASAKLVATRVLEEGTADVDPPTVPFDLVCCDFCGRRCGPFIHRWLGRW